MLKHSVEWLNGCKHGREIGADVNLAKRAGLLHDIEKVMDHEVEGSHRHQGQFAQEVQESQGVIKSHRNHHGDVEPQTVEAFW